MAKLADTAKRELRDKLIPASEFKIQEERTQRRVAPRPAGKPAARSSRQKTLLQDADRVAARYGDTMTQTDQVPGKTKWSVRPKRDGFKVKATF